MEMNEYQVISQGTAGTPLECSALGLCGEAGEVADYLKKHLYHGHSLEREVIVRELGDVLWYIADIAHKLGISLGYVAQINISKLQARYPQGFSQERSINRDEGK